MDLKKSPLIEIQWFKKARAPKSGSRAFVVGIVCGTNKKRLQEFENSA